jgi:alanyl-tRNA synthetase
MQEEIADKQAALLLADAPQVNGHKLVRQVFSGRDLAYIKLLAQKLTRVQPGVVALLGTTSPPSVIAAASPGQTLDMGAILKEVLGHHGGRGGGSKDMAQGGVPNAELVERVIAELAEKIR